MGRAIHRRLGLLAVVGVAAAAVAIVARAPSIPIAAAAAASATHSHTSNVSQQMAPCPFPENLRRYFEAAANDTQLPVALLYAVAKVESNLHQNARSAAGARGLLQLMPATARSLDLDPDQARENVLAGARYLKQLFTQFNSADLALAAYNAGPTAVAAAGQAPSADVVRYVANVDEQWRSVAGCR